MSGNKIKTNPIRRNKRSENESVPLTVHLTTLGCSKNQYDSEILMGQLQANGVQLTDDPLQADTIIINTCGFITPAKQESIEAILEAGEIKKRKPNTRVLVCGCLSQRYMEDLKKDIPEVDAYFGTEDFENILHYLKLHPRSPEHLYEHRLLSRPAHLAYLKISEGCNHECAFCAIPLIRGRHRSRPQEEILREAEMLAERGVKELIVIAQDTTYYGIDLYGEQRILPLLQELEQIDGLRWIRLHYTYPTTFPDSLIELMARSEKIVHYADLPVQHITDSMLRVMKRGGSSRRIRQILRNLRRQIPDVALRTTLIVGHPGETESDFLQLKEFVEEIRFDRLGVFVYSPEEGTAAYRLPHPPQEVAEARYREIMEIQQKISLEKNLAKVGKIYQVLIDDVFPEDGYAVGRTYADSPEIDNEVLVEPLHRPVKPGDFYNVKMTDAMEYQLIGQLVEDE